MFALEKGHVVLVLSLDLSAAFDTIDREILISRLSSKIGVYFDSSMSMSYQIDNICTDPTTVRRVLSLKLKMISCLR